MSRVNWAAKSSHEYVANYKLLQNAFNKQKIQKHVDVDKLIRGKYQDNLEFCQWLKAFFDQTSPMMSGGREGYDPVAVRAKGKGGKTVGKGACGGGVKKASSSASSRVAVSRGSRTGGTTGGTSRTTATTRTSSNAASTASSSRPTSSSTSSRTQKENKANSSSSSSSSSASRSLPVNPRKTSVNASSAASSATKSKYEEEIRSLKSENTTLKAKYATLEHAAAEVEVTLQTVESERDFYFEKLRGIEVMLQVYKEKEDEESGSGNVTKLMDSMFRVMYATMDDNVGVDESGNVSTYPPNKDYSYFCFFVHMHHWIGTLNGLLNGSVLNTFLLHLKLLGDITGLDEASNLDSSGSALLSVNSVKAQDELVADEVPYTEDVVNNAPEENVTNQFSDDSDDDELLTAGLDDDEPDDEPEAKNKLDEIDGEFKECVESAIVDDDDFADDEDLRSD